MSDLGKTACGVKLCGILETLNGVHSFAFQRPGSGLAQNLPQAVEDEILSSLTSVSYVPRASVDTDSKGHIGSFCISSFDIVEQTNSLVLNLFFRFLNRDSTLSSDNLLPKATFASSLFMPA